jgi:hypothetical protein
MTGALKEGPVDCGKVGDALDITCCNAALRFSVVCPLAWALLLDLSSNHEAKLKILSKERKHFTPQT